MIRGVIVVENQKLETSNSMSFTIVYIYLYSWFSDGWIVITYAYVMIPLAVITQLCIKTMKNVNNYNIHTIRIHVDYYRRRKLIFESRFGLLIFCWFGDCFVEFVLMVLLELSVDAPKMDPLHPYVKQFMTIRPLISGLLLITAVIAIDRSTRTEERLAEVIRDHLTSLDPAMSVPKRDREADLVKEIMAQLQSEPFTAWKLFAIDRRIVMGFGNAVFTTCAVFAGFYGSCVCRR